MRTYLVTRDVLKSIHGMNTLLELVPDGLASPPPAADERYFHTDLPGLTDGELRLERERLRVAVLLLPKAPAWAIERLERIEAEIEARNVR